MSSPVEVSGTIAKPVLSGLEQSSLTTQQFVFHLQSLLGAFSQPGLADSIELTQSDDQEWSVFIKAAGIGVDVGYAAYAPTLSGVQKVPGYRVYTMNQTHGSRMHPPEDYDVTRLETVSMMDALACVGSLLAQAALWCLPELPSHLVAAERPTEEVF